TVENRARVLARYEDLGGWKRVNEYVSRLRKVSPADVLRVARKYLDPGRAALVELLPENSEARALSAESVEGTIRDLLAVAVAEDLAAEEKETRPALVVPEAPAAFRASEVRRGMVKASVLRGPELFIREDHTAPVIDLGLFFPGGKLAEKPEHAGVTALL